LLKAKEIIMKSIIIFIGLTLTAVQLNFAQEVRLYSPNRTIEVRVNPAPDMTYSIYYKQKLILKPSRIAMQINDGYMLGVHQKLIKKTAINIEKNIKPAISTKYSLKRSHYQGMVFTFKVSNLREYDVEFRVYNSGIAYRFTTHFENEVQVENETVELNFPSGTMCYLPEESSMISHYERLYKYLSLDNLGKKRLSSLPILMQTQGVNVLFTEVDVIDYPNLFLRANGSGSFKGEFPHLIKETRPNPRHADRSEIVVRTKRQMAMTYGKRNFPWRLFMISDRDKDLIENNLVVTLSKPTKLRDIDWIKPGKVVWDWYSANDIYKEEFQKPINTETYKYYIDFASKYGFEYVLLDEGWSQSTIDVFEANKNINIPELVEYANANDVGLLLWLLWKPLDNDLDSILKTYKKWGIKGIKVDFMQRADQYMVNFYERVAKTAARDSLIVDFHGAYKPSGLNIRYPNVMSFEGVKGNENNKWSKDITPKHTLLIPFIRMSAGPMDFTPGAMANAHPSQFGISYTKPMSLGTRTRQVAMYVVYESPLQMLCDAPSRYENNPEIPEFISRIPTTWDETRVVDAKIGEYLIIARRKGKNWYLAAMTDSIEREFTIPYSSFLTPGSYFATFMEDGLAAQTNANDYEIINHKITSRQSFTIKMVSGGAFVAIFDPIARTKGKKKKKKKKKRK
jgi:alpha-glucosidase